MKPSRNGDEGVKDAPSEDVTGAEAGLDALEVGLYPACQGVVYLHSRDTEKNPGENTWFYGEPRGEGSPARGGRSPDGG